MRYERNSAMCARNFYFKYGFRSTVSLQRKILVSHLGSVMHNINCPRQCVPTQRKEKPPRCKDATGKKGDVEKEFHALPAAQVPASSAAKSSWWHRKAGTRKAQCQPRRRWWWWRSSRGRCWVARVVVWEDDQEQRHVVWQHEGGEHSDPLMPLLFSLAIHNSLTEVEAFFFAFLDDVYIVVPPRGSSSCTIFLDPSYKRELGFSADLVASTSCGPCRRISPSNMPKAKMTAWCPRCTRCWEDSLVRRNTLIWSRRCRWDWVVTGWGPLCECPSEHIGPHGRMPCTWWRSGCPRSRARSWHLWTPMLQVVVWKSCKKPHARWIATVSWTDLLWDSWGSNMADKTTRLPLPNNTFGRPWFFPSCSADQAHLRSHSGPRAGDAMLGCPTRFEFQLQPEL